MIVAIAGVPNRQALVLRGQRLEYFTIGYNSLEGLIAIVAGLIAGSIALVGFGFDSLIEVTSGVALLWRLHADVLLNALFGWWWADPIAALVMVPIIVNEGIEALRGETCCDDECH